MQQETNLPQARPFRVCEHCGRLTPTQQPQCANCGATSVSAMIDDEERRAERNFAQAYFSRSTPVTYALLALNAAVFLLMLRFGGSEDSQVLIAFGAKTNGLLRQGEWFRLVTPIFIHAGLLHIFSNSYALWMVGPQVEKLYGSARFLLIYLLCGIGGVAGSYIGQEMLHKPSVPSVGASGAIFGLFGVLAVFGVRYRKELPTAFRGAFGRSVLPVIAINLFIGFSVPFIDNSAHIGGLATGAALTFLIPYLAPGKKRVTPLNVGVLVLCAAVVAVCFVQAYQKSGDHLARRGSGGMQGYLNGINAATRASNQVFAALSSAGGNRPAAEASLTAAQKTVEKAIGPDDESEQIRQALVRLLNEQRTLLDAARPDPQKIKAAVSESNKIQTRLESWVRSEGGKYGLRIDETQDEKK